MIGRRAGGAAALLIGVLIAGCAATGVTLRSNHFDVYVPPDWEVVESGGAAGNPTLLRTRTAATTEGAVEVRLYPWLVHGPVADPTGEAHRRLADLGLLDRAGASPDDESPCADGYPSFVVFGQPARSLNFTTRGAQNGILTAGYADGSLVAIVAIATSRQPPKCTPMASMSAAIRQLTDVMASSADPTRPPVRPTTLVHPARGDAIDIPAADPGPIR